MSGVDHDSTDVLIRLGQGHEHPRKDTHAAPADPTVVERLGRPIGRRCVSPAEAITVDEDDAAEV